MFYDESLMDGKFKLVEERRYALSIHHNGWVACIWGVVYR